MLALEQTRRQLPLVYPLFIVIGAQGTTQITTRNRRRVKGPCSVPYTDCWPKQNSAISFQGFERWRAEHTTGDGGTVLGDVLQMPEHTKNAVGQGVPLTSLALGILGGIGLAWHLARNKKKESKAASTTLNGTSSSGSGKNSEEIRSVADLVRPNIRELTPYRCARDDYSEGILLDANENSYGPALPAGQGQLDLTGLELNRYPDPQQMEVKKLLAEMRGVRPEQIFVGVGSDEAIDLLMRIFCRPGEDTILVTPPTYGMYKVSAKVNDVQVHTVPLTPEFEVVVSQVLRAANRSTKLLFLCSPGNPTGKSVPASVIRDIVKGGFDGMVVVDEAYVDFSGHDSACSLIDELDRVIVLQTLSKAFGMAAIRMGFAYANEQVIQYMNNVKAPYNVNRLSQEVAVRALSDRSLYKERVAAILEERKRLQDTLRELDFVKEVKETDANFFLMQVDNAEAIYKRMAENGVVVRFRGNELHCKGCLRITVGNPEENARLVDLLKETAAAVNAAI